MEKEEIAKFIVKFISEEMGVELSDEIKTSKDSLLNPDRGIEPRDLLVLVMEFQQMFSIELYEEDVLNRRLDYVENLAKWIYAAGGSTDKGAAFAYEV